MSARIVCATLLLAMPSLAHAEQEPDVTSPSVSDRVRAATHAGDFLPLTLAASVARGHALAAGYGGYDSAARAARLESFAEAHLYGPLALRFGAQSRDANASLAPSVTGRLQVLSQAGEGVDGTISLAYKAEGFDEPEGELELVLAAARSEGRWRLVGNLAYGQDAEGRERDGEVRAAALYHLSASADLGLDGRARADLGSDASVLREHDEPTFDMDVGPVLTVGVGPVALGVHGGVAAVQSVGGDARLGFVGLAGLGTAL